MKERREGKRTCRKGGECASASLTCQTTRKGAKSKGTASKSRPFAEHVTRGSRPSVRKSESEKNEGEAHKKRNSLTQAYRQLG